MRTHVQRPVSQQSARRADRHEHRLRGIDMANVGRGWQLVLCSTHECGVDWTPFVVIVSNGTIKMVSDCDVYGDDAITSRAQSAADDVKHRSHTNTSFTTQTRIRIPSKFNKISTLFASTPDLFVRCPYTLCVCALKCSHWH